MGYRFLHFFALSIVVFGAIVWDKPLHAQDRSVLTLQEYETELRQIRSSLGDGPPASALQNAQTQLQQVLTITLPSGAEIAITPLLTDVTDSKVALQRIDTTLDQITRSATDQTDTRLDQLQSILDRRPSNPLARAWERFQRWLRDFLRQFEQNGAPSPAVLATGQSAGWVIIAIAGVVLALFLGYWLQGILGNLIADRKLRRNGGDDDLPATAAEARQEAQELAQAGNYREAVRHLYLAAVLGLDEAGLIRYDRTLTNREVLAQTEGEAAVQSHLRPVVETFDEVWYGIHEPDETSYRGYVREIDGLEAMVKRSGESQ